MTKSKGTFKTVIVLVLVFLITDHIMSKNLCFFHFQIRNCFPFLKAYFSKYQTSILGPFHHIQRQQWIKLNIEVLSVEINWYLK